MPWSTPGLGASQRIAASGASRQRRATPSAPPLTSSSTLLASAAVRARAYAATHFASGTSRMTLYVGHT
jgi:hypothetical protein